MLYRVFFSDYCEDKHLPAEKAEASDVESILHSMACVLCVPNNFLGFKDSAGRTIQFVVNDDQSILVDVPMPDEGGSYSMTTDLDACFALVRELDGNIDPKKHSKLQYGSWEEANKTPWWRFW